MHQHEAKLTAQGQISVPAQVRRKLDIRPGSVLEWDTQGGDIVVRRAGHLPLAAFDRGLGKLPGAQKL